MTETVFLGDAHRGETWASTLTGAQYRWNEGWEVKATIGGITEWRPYKAGWVTTSVYARSGEKFLEVPGEEI